MKSVKLSKRKLMVLHLVAVIMLVIGVGWYFFRAHDPVVIQGNLEYLNVSLEGNISFSASRMDFYGDNGVFLKRLKGDVVLDGFEGRLGVVNDTLFILGKSKAVHIDEGVINTTSFKIVIDEGSIPISLNEIEFGVRDGKFRFGSVGGDFGVGDFRLENFSGLISFKDHFEVEGKCDKAFFNSSKIGLVYNG